MSTLVRRVRGALLRLAFQRRAAFAVGCILAGGSLWLMAGDYPWESWVSDGLGLVCGASGVALLTISLSGRRPDWIE